MDKKNIGSDFDDFLMKEGILAEAEAIALKNIFSWEIQNVLKEQGLTKIEAAKRMNTSRAAFDRILDPSNISITLKSLEKAAISFGKKIHIELRDITP